jgi:hypothetical protein
MATIDNEIIIKELIARNGYYPDDPRVWRIVEYTNCYGVRTWGVTWPHEQNRDRYLLETYYVRSPKNIWCAQDFPE